jgi:outer membrane protein OmpA-like peptidoglycan-associated protein
MFLRFTLLSTFLFFATAAVAQQQQPTRTESPRQDVTPAKTPEQTIPHEYELNFFAGASYFNWIPDELHTKLRRGGIVGGQFTANPWNHWGIETGYTIYGVNNIDYRTLDGGKVSLGSRDFAVYINPVFHFTDRLSRVRPYVTAGYGANVYYPTRDAKRQAAAMPNVGDRMVFSAIDTSTRGTLNFGGGVKWRVTKGGGVGLRFDVRGLISDAPTFHIAAADNTLYGIQPSVGINFWFGKKPQDKEFEKTITITNPAPPAVTRNNITATQITGSGGEVCGGSPVNLSVTATPTPANAQLRYQWQLNGTNAGTNANTYMFTAPDAGGDQRVQLTISDATPGPNAAQPVTITQTVRVRPYVRPTIRVAAGATEVDSAATLPLVATVAGDCGGALTTTWTASEGRVTPNAQNPVQATFDPATVNFGNTGVGDQVKQVTVTANVRDTRNGTAAGTAQVSVRKKAVAVQLADILFTAGNATVNNCGQRILTDDVYPQFRNGYTVVLVGHSDSTDRNAANIDRTRVYNVGKLLATGGRSPNNKIDGNNIKVDWVGTDQSAPKKSRQCESSVREAPSRTISANDTAAANRRVEVWLVPTGATMPASARQPKELPENQRK